MTADIIVLTVFLLANLALGIFAGKDISNLETFSVGKRAFNSFVIFATLTATYVGGGFTLGNAAKVYNDGMIYAFALLGFSLKEVLVGSFVAPHMNHFRDCLTVGDIMGKHYGKSVKILTGLLSMILCGGVLGSQVSAMGAVFHTFFHITELWGIVIGFSIIIAYTTIGGMTAVVYTDLLQFCVLIIGLPLTFFIGLHHVGGLTAVAKAVPHHHLAFLQNGHHLVLFLSLFITFVFGETLVPPYVQRLLMGKSAAHTRNATIASGLLSVPLFLIAGGIGLVAFTANSSLPENAAFPFVVQTMLPVALRGVVIAAIIAIIMSSASGYLNAASIAFVNDVVQPLSRDVLTHQRSLSLAKISTFMVGILSIIFAMMISNILDILLYAYNFWSPIILVPLLAVIFKVPAQHRDFCIGAITGILTLALWNSALHQPYHVSGVLIGILGNLSGFMMSRKLGNIGIKTTVALR